MKGDIKPTRLGDVCENLDGRRVPVTKSDRKAGNVPYYGASGVVDYVAGYIFDDDLLLVSEDGANLLARTYPIAFPITGKTWVNNHAHVLRFREKATQTFVEYYLNSIPLNEYVSGMAQPKLNQKALNSILIPLPLLLEQKRIVSLLDEAFEGIDTAVANTEKNLANARELFDSYLNSIFVSNGEVWVPRTLEEMGRLQTGTTPKTSEKNNIGTHIPFIKPGDFRADGSLDYENEGLSKLGLTQSRLIPAGSAVMVCIGATIGKAGFVERDISANQQINAITPAMGISGKFLYYQMISNDFQNRVMANSAQATLPIINKTKWGGLTLLLPPTLQEQEKFVSKLDQLSSQVRRLEQTFQQKLACLAELKQAILQKAFAGELTAHPDEALQAAAE